MEILADGVEIFLVSANVIDDVHGLGRECGRRACQKEMRQSITIEHSARHREWLNRRARR
jgi:hypothetical protein